MKIRYLSKIAVIALTGGILLSCSSNRHYERSKVDTSGLFDNLPEDSLNMALEPWQNLFNDPLLVGLIQEGLQNNLDLRMAIKRVDAAEAYFLQSRSAIAPTLGLDAGGTYVRRSESTYPNGPREYSGTTLRATSSWEVDIWGKLRGAKRAAYADYMGSNAAKKAIQTQLVSGIANTYYNILALDQKLAITEQTVENNANLVETMKILKATGRVTGAAVVQSEATRYATEVTIPNLKQQVKALESTLCILLGRTPGTITRSTLTEQQASELLHVGVPSDLLENRPDVMQAEYGVISAFELTNSAKAYFYPSLVLTANAGFEALDLSDFFDPTSFATEVIGGLTQPIFNRRANRTRLEVAKAQKEEALLNFRLTLLNAGKEVTDALYTYEAAEARIDIRNKQLQALVKSVEYTQALLDYGSATYTEVLYAQQSLLIAQLNNVDDHLQKLSSVVTLYRALGGGWD